VAIFIVFHPPTESDPNKYYVKRIIGIPGDTITITPTAVFVDGQKLSEPYIYPLPSGMSENPVVLPKVVLKAGEYFVMGDNRLDSQDSRFFGPIVRGSIVGKAEAVVWPANAITWLKTYTAVFAAVHQ